MPKINDKITRARRREDAEERNSRTLPERRRAFRSDRPGDEEKRNLLMSDKERRALARAQSEVSA